MLHLVLAWPERASCRAWAMGGWSGFLRARFALVHRPVERSWTTCPAPTPPLSQLQPCPASTPRASDAPAPPPRPATARDASFSTGERVAQVLLIKELTWDRPELSPLTSGLYPGGGMIYFSSPDRHPPSPYRPAPIIVTGGLLRWRLPACRAGPSPSRSGRGGREASAPSSANGSAAIHKSPSAACAAVSGCVSRGPTSERRGGSIPSARGRRPRAGRCLRRGLR